MELTETHSIVYKTDNKQDLLYCKGNNTQYLVITYNRKESAKEYIYIYVYIYMCVCVHTQKQNKTKLNHFEVYQKLT